MTLRSKKKTMPQITPNQIKLIHTLLPNHLKEQDAKAEFIHSFTEDDQRTSTRDLSHHEAEEIIYFLKTGKSPTYAHFATFDQSNRQHRYILSLCHQLNWVRPSAKGKLVADLETLGRWLRKYGYLHKPMKEYSDREFPKLVTQLENILKTKHK